MSYVVGPLMRAFPGMLHLHPFRMEAVWELKNVMLLEVAVCQKLETVTMTGCNRVSRWGLLAI